MTGLEVLGQERALEALRELGSSSLLLVGPEGVGRRRAARWLAALLNCSGDRGFGPCGECDSCRRFETGHPDYREVAPRVTTSSGRRSPRPEIRIGQLVQRPGEEDPLAHWLEQRPVYRRRVGVIDGAHRLTTAAANSFLKMLEEPPSFSTIVLVAPSSQAVLPTVASRCSIVRFAAVDTSKLGQPGHPAHRLGRPGPLLQPDEGFAAASDAVSAFMDSLGGTLAEALEAADALAERWGAGDGTDVLEILRARVSELPAVTRAKADDLVLESSEALAAYSPPALTLRVLALELRAVLDAAR